MSSTTSYAARQAFITGLRDLADYLASHPTAPVPAYGTEILLSARSTDDGGCAQVNQFARLLNAVIDDDFARTGHYGAARSFGPVGYRITAISDTAVARHHAEMSYSGCVTPDSQPDTWT